MENLEQLNDWQANEFINFTIHTANYKNLLKPDSKETAYIIPEEQHKIMFESLFQKPAHEMF